ncbi:MAG: hypothetical protein ACI80P_001791 [Flavobacteriales bacterium]|jgi:hypothetical protein
MFTCVLMSFGALADLPKVLLYGNVIDSQIQEVISPQENKPTTFVDHVMVTVICAKDTISMKPNRNTGFYSVVLESGKKYSVTFSKEGYISKSFTIDASNVDAIENKKSFKMFTDVSLFQLPKESDFSSCEKRPMAKCVYVPAKERMEWDMDYAKLAFDHFLSSVKQNSTASLSRN